MGLPRLARGRATTCEDAAGLRRCHAPRARPTDAFGGRAPPLRGFEGRALISPIAELLGEVSLLPQVLDELELGLQPVDVILFGHEDAGEQILGGVVALVAGEADPVGEPL